MNKLEEYKQSEARKRDTDSLFGLKRVEEYKEGFDAAIALDLPVKFAEWKDYEYDLISIPNQSDKAKKKCLKLREKIWNHFGDIPETKELYQYWIENIYQP